ncbi:hypothetical protein B0H14DRAFT_2597120 [Mycena olivaceomarginata]|nr:hypothetical protein B0H14DRAFT_2597120 [Mycena olivaceomarginata]
MSYGCGKELRRCLYRCAAVCGAAAKVSSAPRPSRNPYSHKVRNLMAAMQLALIDKLGFCGLITRTVVSMLVDAGKAVESWAEGAGGVDWAVRISGTKYSGDKIWKVNASTAQSIGRPVFHTSSFSKEAGLVRGRVVFPDLMMLADNQDLNWDALSTCVRAESKEKLRVESQYASQRFEPWNSPQIKKVMHPRRMCIALILGPGPRDMMKTQRRRLGQLVYPHFASSPPQLTNGEAVPADYEKLLESLPCTTQLEEVLDSFVAPIMLLVPAVAGGQELDTPQLATVEW